MKVTKLMGPWESDHKVSRQALSGPVDTGYGAGSQWGYVQGTANTHVPHILCCSQKPLRFPFANLAMSGDHVRGSHLLVIKELACSWCIHLLQVIQENGGKKARACAGNVGKGCIWLGFW